MLDEDGQALLYESTKNADVTPDVCFDFEYLGMHAFKIEVRSAPSPQLLVLGSWVGARQRFPPFLTPNRAPHGFTPRS